MKIAIIGAGGVRTPLIVQAMHERQDRLGLTELSLMDIDGERLELIGALTAPLDQSSDIKFHITRTTDPHQALHGADFVIMTFRVGGIESRAIDERVPLAHGILGQETTGPGGFAMGLRSIPVLLDYVHMMTTECPDAWLINFANPAGMLTEAILHFTDRQRVVGICDFPASMHALICVMLGAEPSDVYLDYFGLNHLGWIKRIMYHNQDHLPEIIQLVKSIGAIPGLPFDKQLITTLGMIPNEYLYYFYYAIQAVNHILKAGESRGEQIAKLNLELFAELQAKFDRQDYIGMQVSYQTYMATRSNTYMVTETGQSHDLSSLLPFTKAPIPDEGYAGVALNLIEALQGNKPVVQILNVANHGAITGMEDLDVVEIPALISHHSIQTLTVNNIPTHCMGLIQQVKQYEHLTIEAAVEKSYQKAILALALHPLVRDFTVAKSILDEYIGQHHGYFPGLQ